MSNTIQCKVEMYGESKSVLLMCSHCTCVAATTSVLALRAGRDAVPVSPFDSRFASHVERGPRGVQRSLRQQQSPRLLFPWCASCAQTAEHVLVLVYEYNTYWRPLSSARFTRALIHFCSLSTLITVTVHSYSTHSGFYCIDLLICFATNRIAL